MNIKEKIKNKQKGQINPINIIIVIVIIIVAVGGYFYLSGGVGENLLQSSEKTEINAIINYADGTSEEIQKEETMSLVEYTVNGKEVESIEYEYYANMSTEKDTTAIIKWLATVKGYDSNNDIWFQRESNMGKAMQKEIQTNTKIKLWEKKIDIDKVLVSDFQMNETRQIEGYIEVTPMVEDQEMTDQKVTAEKTIEITKNVKDYTIDVMLDSYIYSIFN